MDAIRNSLPSMQTVENVSSWTADASTNSLFISSAIVYIANRLSFLSSKSFNIIPYIAQMPMISASILTVSQVILAFSEGYNITITHEGYKSTRFKDNASALKYYEPIYQKLQKTTLIHIVATCIFGFFTAVNSGLLLPYAAALQIPASSLALKPVLFAISGLGLTISAIFTAGAVGCLLANREIISKLESQ